MRLLSDGISVHFERSNLTIQFRQNGGWFYEIDLERCNNSAQLLDWIFQVQGKKWCSPELLAAVLDTIEEACVECFGSSVQGKFCSFGIDNEVAWPSKENATRKFKQSAIYGTVAAAVKIKGRARAGNAFKTA